jgi:lipopolysaccharide export system permease protein
LTRRYELIVVRSAGFSVWQFLGPVIGIAICLGFFNMTIVNPVGSILLSKYERLESEYLSHRKNYVTLLKEGLWLRQIQQDGHVILHAQKIDIPSWRLNEVMVLFFDQQDNFRRRIDAESASLDEDKGTWLFENVTNNEADAEPQTLPLIALPTDLTEEELEESFSSPETMSFWAMPDFIRTLEATGFDATEMRIHYHSLLAQPLLFTAMILLAATVSLRPPRLQGTAGLVAAGIAIGFLVFFLSSFLKALGASHQIPVVLAAWSPALVTTLLGMAVMLNLEDG